MLDSALNNSWHILPWWMYLVLVALGGLVGVINVIAGGGSNLTLPLMMAFGVPPDIANASNRVGIFFQNISAVQKFNKKKVLPVDDLLHYSVPVLIGAALGAGLAATLGDKLPPNMLKYILLITLLVMATIILIKPLDMFAHDGTQHHTLKTRPVGWIYLIFIGFYGGFIQAGIGYIEILFFAGVMRYNLAQTNALKVSMVVIFTALALLIFGWHNQINWYIGGALAIGSVVGARLGVHLAVKKINPRTFKWLLFVLTVTSVVVALARGAA